MHRWYRFVLSFPPHLVREYLERFDAHKGSTVLDPFCGTGTTVVECKKNGIPSFGIEAMPSVREQHSQRGPQLDQQQTDLGVWSL